MFWSTIRTQTLPIWPVQPINSLSKEIIKGVEGWRWMRIDDKGPKWVDLTVGQRKECPSSSSSPSSWPSPLLKTIDSKIF